MDSEKNTSDSWPLLSLLKWAAAVVPSIVGPLFFAGSLYWWSYCSYWGLSGDMFPRSFQDTVSYGVIAVMLSFGEVSVPLLWAALAMLLISFLSSYLGRVWSPETKHFNQPKLLKNIESRLDKWFPKHKRPSLQQIKKDNIVAAIFLMFSVGIIFLLSVLLIFYLTFYKIGGNIAEDQHERLKSTGNHGKPPSLAVVKFVSGVDLDASIQRQLIFCFPEDCVFLQNSGVEVVSRANILSITTSTSNDVSK